MTMTDKITVTQKQAEIVNAVQTNGNGVVEAATFDQRSLRHLKNRGIVKNAAGGKLALTKAAERSTFVTAVG